MNIRELYIKLKELNISEDRYYLHGLYGSTSDDDKLSLQIKQSKSFLEYEVYFKERGEKHSVRIFKTECEACQYLYKKLKQNKEFEDMYLK